MTMSGTAPTANPPRSSDDQISEYLRKKYDLWNYFYGLTSKKRFRILANESKYLFLFWLGYVGCMFLWKHVVLGVPSSRYIFFLTHLFDSRAFAQTPASSSETVLNMTYFQWRLAIWLVFHVVLIIILLGCVAHMLYSARPRPWVGKTATFLLGFLVKALTGFTP
jgi:hypothetical protein